MSCSAMTIKPMAHVLGAGMDMQSILDHVLPHKLFEIGNYTFTNHMFMLVLSALLLMIIVPIAASKTGLVPKGFRNCLEAVMQYIREDIARPLLGSVTDRCMPFLWTLFFLILTANLLGMIPLSAAAAGIDAHLQHLGGTATGNISITLGLALCAFFYVHITGMRVQGVGKYWNNFFFGHAPIWMAPLMIPLEIVGALVKPFALCVRLFANMTAGHIVLAIFLGFAVVGIKMGGAMLGVTLASALGALAISLLELFVAFLQAYIFTFLTALFLGAAVHSDH